MDMSESLEKYSQVCVWPACIVGKENAEDFEKTMNDELGVRVRYIEDVLTLPDKVDGEDVPDTGGRSDLLFRIHDEDIPRFAIKRLNFGIRWLEDVYDNMGDNIIYPAYVREYLQK